MQTVVDLVIVTVLLDKFLFTIGDAVSFMFSILEMTSLPFTLRWYSDSDNGRQAGINPVIQKSF